MNIVLIGTGNVAVVLGKKLKAAAHNIVQVYGRNHIAASLIAQKIGANTCSSLKDITQEADIYIIAVSDNALTSNNIHLPLKDQLVVHTAGSVSIEILKTMSSSYGVLYPYQTIRKETELLPAVPFLIDANNDIAKQQLQTLAQSISSKVIIANDLQRMQYQLCAVITNNFSNYLYTLAQDYCNKNGLSFNMLLPIIDETASRLHHFSAAAVQTGPAIRKDLGTIQHHLDLLNDEPALKNLYKIFSGEILHYHS